MFSSNHRSGRQGEGLHDVMALDDGFLSTKRLNVKLDGTPVILYTDRAQYYVPKRFHIPSSD